MATEIQAAPAGMTMIHNVSLEEFEKAVYARDHEKASALLLLNLRKLKAGAQFIGYAPDGRIQPMLYTRFCAAVISLLADPEFLLTQDGFDHLASEHAVMDLLFRASAFQTSDHLLALSASNPGPDASKLQMTDGAALAKFFMTYSLTSMFKLDFEATFSKAPQHMLSLYAGMISPLLTTAVQAQERREMLLGLHGIFAGCDLSDAVLPTLSDAYMYTSYGSRRDKHDAKATIHGLLARMLDQRGVVIPALAAPARKDRPTILICIEWFNSNHAMYRCYAPIIRQLRQRFRLVAMSIAGSIDDVGKTEFDEWHEVEAQGLVLEGLIKRITALAPDIIYYPSVGMALWWVALASVRLAPVQVMTLGHPASTRSPAMDYVLCDAGAIGDPALFTEEIVEYENGSARFIMRPDADIPEPLREPATDVIKIAVPAMLCKLNADFMRTLREIRNQAGRPVEFHFFINMLGVNLIQAAKEIKEWLPDSKIYERRHFNQYIRELRECHLHCSTFPFGGTNSNIDSMLMGLPIVTLWGDEPHERFDGMMIRRAGLPESLVAKSRDAYIAEAVRLVQDDAARQALREHLLGFDLQSEFFGEAPDNTAFLRAMESIYERQFDQPGSAGATDAGAAPDGSGRRGTGIDHALVPGPAEADRPGSDAEGLGEHRGVLAEARP